MKCSLLHGPLAVLTLLAVPVSAAVPSAFTSAGLGGGGALFSPSLSPHSPGELYVACDMSELFHSTSFGASWAVVPFTQVQGNRNSRVAFTSDPDILFTVDHAGDLNTPVRSADGGVTWTPLGEDPTFGECFTLLADPASTQRLIVSGYSTLFFSADGGASFDARFTAGGGNGLHVAGAHWDGATIFAGTSAGVLVSTDGGASFSLAGLPALPAGEAIVSFAGAREGTTTRLFAVTAPSADVYAGIFIEDLFGLDAPLRVRALDVGAPGWQVRESGLDASHRFVHVGMAADDIDHVYLAGGVHGQDFPALWRSTDGGVTWQPSLLTANNQNVATGWAGHQGDRQWSYGGGITGLGVAPNDADRAAFTDYGFIHVTSDGGQTWRQAYLAQSDENPAGAATPQRRRYHSAGLENTSCWNITWLSDDVLWASFSDIRGLRSTDGGETWSFDYSGHTHNTSYDCVLHPGTGAAYLATSTAHDLYQSTYLTDARIDGAGGTVRVSTDLGATWTLIRDFGDPVFDLELDPADPNTMYACTAHSANGGIWRTTNLDQGAAATWTRLPAPPRTEGHAFCLRVLADGTLVSTFTGRRTTVFTDSSGVFVLPPGETVWSDVSHANMHHWVKELVIDPHDATQSTWYVCVWSGWGGPLATNNQAGGLYRTVNRGQSWTRLLGHDPVDRVTSITIHPADPEQAYVTTETDGLWHTSNLSAAQPVFAPVAAYPFRQPQQVLFRGGELWITSFGHGMRRAPLAPASAQLTGLIAF